MRLSELLGSEVVGADGESLGKVHDVRLVQDGPLLGTWGAALRVDCLLVGGGSIGTRLGVDREHSSRKPWIVAVFFARRRRAEVPWSDVADCEPGRITLGQATTKSA